VFSIAPIVSARLSLKLVPKLTTSKTGFPDFPSGELAQDDNAATITKTAANAQLKKFFIKLSS
jgi:hypothetical protein